MKPAQNAFTAFSHERASPSIGFCVTGRPGCLQNAVVHMKEAHAVDATLTTTTRKPGGTRSPSRAYYGASLDLSRFQYEMEDIIAEGDRVVTRVPGKERMPEHGWKSNPLVLSSR